MESEESVRRRQEASSEFNQHEGRGDGDVVAGSLSGGLTIVRDSLYVRLHEDVQRKVGMDSMLLPVSPEKTEKLTKIEIELFELAVSATTVAERGYVQGDDSWFLPWLTRLRLGRLFDDPRVLKRLATYRAASADAQWRTFSNVLAGVVPESRRAPLVLFRLVPQAVRIATALAFGDHATADHARQQQTLVLPSIRDCHRCHGKLLENGEQCAGCGNPLWKFEWLTAAD